MAALLVAHHRPGFYFRVLEEGEVAPAMKSSKLPRALNASRSPQPTRCSIFPDPPKKNLSGLCDPALSPGWKSSFEALLRQMTQPGSRTGNAGLASPEQMITAVPGFRPLKVARMDRESSSVVSLVLEPVDGRPLTVPFPGQFVVLRLRPNADAPPVLPATRLSNLPDPGRYRITIKQEPHGIASTYVSTQLRTGDVLDVSEPRGAFTLKRGDLPVVLLSAGVGVTPVMAMLHAWRPRRRCARSGGFMEHATAWITSLPGKHAICWLNYPTPGATSSTAGPMRLTDWVSISMLPAG